MNLTEEEWAGLAEINREFLDENSILRRDMKDTVMSLAANAMGPVAENR